MLTRMPGSAAAAAFSAAALLTAIDRDSLRKVRVGSIKQIYCLRPGVIVALMVMPVDDDATVRSVLRPVAAAGGPLAGRAVARNSHAAVIANKHAVLDAGDALPLQ